MWSLPRSQASGTTETLTLRPHASDMVRVFEVSLIDAQIGVCRCVYFMELSFRSLPPRGRGTTKWWKEPCGAKDQGEENNYISGNSEIISSKNVSSRGLLHPLRGSPLPEGAMVATTPEAPNTPTNPNLLTTTESFIRTFRFFRIRNKR